MLHIPQRKIAFRVLIVSMLMLAFFITSSPAAAFGPSGNPFRVNTYTPNGQGGADLTMDANGNFVVVWVSYWGMTIDTGQDGSYSGIYGQRYNSSGVPQGAEFRVNTTTLGIQAAPHVAMDADGDFVVVWESDDGSFTGIYAQRYNAAGVPQGSEFRVNTPTLGQQVTPDVGMDMAGNFVVIWEGQTQLNDNAQIYARAYNNTGSPLGNDFQVNTTDTGTAAMPFGYPVMSMNASGSFVVSWRVGTNTENAFDSYAQRFAGLSVPQGSEFLVNTYTLGDQSVAGVAMGANNDFIIVWNSEDQDGSGMGVYAQRYTPNGFATGSEFRVNTTTENSQVAGDIDIDNHGELIVVWEDTTLNAVYLQRYDSYGATLGGEIPVSSAAGNQGSVVSEIDNQGNYVVVYSNAVGGNVTDVYARRFAEAVPPEFRVNSLIDFSQTFPDVASDDQGNFVVVWSSITLEDPEQGIAAQLYTAAGVKQGNQFTVNSTTSGNQIGAVVAMDADGDFVVAWQSSTVNGNIFARRFNAGGVAQGLDFQVNSTTGGGVPAIAMDDTGNFVIVWEGSGIRGQRYNAAGVAQGGEFRVDTMSLNLPNYANVAMDADGDFVVTWLGDVTFPPSFPVRARRYNANGVAQGDEFAVNSGDVPYASYIPAIAMDEVGNFVIAWSGGVYISGPSVEYDIYAKRYDANGNVQGTQFLVNTTTVNGQDRPDLEMNDSGEFIVVWESWNAASDDAEIYGQWFNANGAMYGGETRINVSTYLRQDYPAVTMDNAGHYVAVWVNQQSINLSQPNFDVFARQLSAPPPPSTTFTENEFYAAFEVERAAFPAISQGIADFVTNGINMTITLSTSETGRVNFTVSSANGIVTLQIASVTTLSGGTPTQSYIDIINRDLPALMTATLDNLVLARFGMGQNVESITLDGSTLTLTLAN